MNLMDVASSDPGRIIPKSSEFNRKRTKTTLPDISRNLQCDFGGIDPSDSDPPRHLSGSGSSPSSDLEDSTDFSPPLGNAETEEHEEDAQDENEDNGLFASEALSDSEEDKSPKQVVVTGRRFKETLREEKPPRVQVGNSRKRRPGEVDSGFVLSKLTPECLVKEQRQFCCKKTCVWNLGINRLRSERKRYFRLSRTERSVYLESLVTKLESGGVVFRLSQNLTVCRKAFKIIFCVGNSRLQRLRLQDKHHASIDTVARQPSAEAFILLEWLDSFFLSHCERQPADGKYHLPNNFTKKEVYDHYRTDMVQVRECLQYSSFKHYWVKFYPLVTIPTTNKFSVCDFCELYKSKRDKSVTNIEKAEAVQALKLHRKQQAEERAAAGRRRWKALDSPKDCAYIQIDGMDQKKTALPHFSKQPKSVDGAALVGVHLVGAMIFHGKLHTQPKLFRTLNDITQNQQYKFKIASALEVRVWRKQFSTDNTWEPPAGVRNILHIDGDRAILASEQVPLKSYAEIKSQTRRVQNIGPLIGRQEGEVVRHVQAIRQDIQTHCYPFFDDEQKDWWNHWFVQQEEIGRNIGNNRRERLVGDMCWFWPIPPERDEHAVDEPVAVTTTEEFRRRIFGQRRPIYSGPRRHAPGSAAADRAAHIEELTEIQEKSFLAVLADDETSFWICQVLKINRRNEEGEPTSVHIQWYATEDSNPYTGKFYPEKRRTNGKGRAALFRQEIDLEEVTVLSFNFIFITARRLRKVTEKQIRTGLFRIARDKVPSQPEVSNRLSQDIDSADDEETECSDPDLEEEEE
ncbi:hypothetical protein R1sor_001633 [Riccia sorocarpa]|uniref:BAH domain-containing protein n=1 Tax=Riccia sorocarpa TaxID=122646 RepID=A0ABD3GYG5_9MARC